MLAAGAVLAVVALAPAAAGASLREPLVWILAALAALSAASAAWTIGEPVAALRWGAVVAGYAGTAVAGFAVARSAGAGVVAGVVLGMALVCGLLGMFGAAARAEPLAERIGGAWRPGGPLEYPPALGALMIAAVPPALKLMFAPARRRAALGALGLCVAAANVALISSRAVLALAVLLLATLVAAAPALGLPRSLALAAVAFALATGCAADAVAGSYAEPYEYGGDAPRVVGLALLLPASVALWLALRACWRADRSPDPARRRRALALAAVPLAIAIPAAALTPDGGEAVEPDAGVTHGRVEIWGAAVDTALERPLAGSGAATFLAASGRFQEPPPARFAHDLVLESWVELGIAGALLALALLARALVLVARARGTEAAWLLGPAALAYLVAMLIDWPWHVPAAAGTFALVLGGLAASGGR